MQFLIDLAIMLIAAKLFADLFEIFKLPELFGAIIAGIVFGPWLGIIDPSNIEQFAEVGLILLLFNIGFKGASFKEIFKNLYTCFFTGTLGLLIPFFLGYLTGLYFGFSLITSLFIGTALSATSISISMSSFERAKKLKTKLANLLLGSEVVDDIGSLVLLIIIISFASIGGFPSLIEFAQIITGVILFGILLFISEHIIPFIFRHLDIFIVEEAQFSISLFLVLLLAFFASKLGLSVVLGAFAAGVLLARIPQLKTTLFLKKLDAVSEGIFIPLFFAWVGLQLVFMPEMFSIISLVLVLIAIFGKLVPAYFTGKLAKLSTAESLGLGAGMIPRGEFGLIVLIVGKQFGAIPDILFASIFLMIVVTTFITPLLLRPVLKYIN